jgi:hypothetical protein
VTAALPAPSVVSPKLCRACDKAFCIGLCPCLWWRWPSARRPSPSPSSCRCAAWVRPL